LSVPSAKNSPIDRAREAHQRGRLAEAEALYREALRRKPRQPAVAYQLAVVLEDAKRVDDAIAVLREALRDAPDHAQSHHYLGILLAQLQHHEKAIAHLRRAVALQPDYSRAWNNLGNALRSVGRLAESVEAFDTALRWQPDYAIAYLNLSNVLRLRGRLPEAESALRKLVALQPNHRQGLVALGGVLRQRDRYDEAAEVYRRVIALDPGSIDARVRLWMVEQAVCDWTHFDAFVQALRQRLGETRPYQVAPFTYLHLPSTPAEQLTAARLWIADRVARSAAAAVEPASTRDEPLRVGYLSSDFRMHPLAALVSELFERHDRSRVTVYAYAYGPGDDSAERRRLMQAVDHWRDIADDTDERAVQRIRDDRIDVLIDLNGYTKFSREDIPALRPARVQMSWLGYLGSLGAPWYDYVITDRFVSPPEQQPNFAERFLYLPHCYCPSDTRRAIAARAPSRRECGLPEQAFVFCCFNNSYKIVPAVFDVWMRLLRDVPDSVLWLVSNQRSTIDNLRREAQRRGIAPERLVFAEYVPMPEYLARLPLADLFLDTYPYNAGATANDALFAGVPLLTCTGETYASRVAGSQLRAIGLPELVTFSLADYEAMALRLAREPELLASLRTRLAQNRHTRPLFDMAAFTRDFEEALASAYDEAIAR
jgi:predicted O-linked N-acetylglucosamine transferase (SPINDLY family)